MIDLAYSRHIDPIDNRFGWGRSRVLQDGAAVSVLSTVAPGGTLQVDACFGSRSQSRWSVSGDIYSIGGSSPAGQFICQSTPPD